MPSGLESTCLDILYWYFTIGLTPAAANRHVVYEYVYTKRCAPSALLLVSRRAPAPADCSLATERRAARRPHVGREATSLSAVSPSNSSIVLLLLAVVDNVLG